MSDAPASRPRRSPRRNAAYDAVPSADQVVVGVVKDGRALERVRQEGWYHIPVRTAPRWVATCGHVALYEPARLNGPEPGINLWASVTHRTRLTRRELLPDEAYNPSADEMYWKLTLGPLLPRVPPLRFARGRRIVFLQTTLAKFKAARSINDLFHDSPLEDALWDALKAEAIDAERQYEVTTPTGKRILDFAVFCERGQIDVECDGDTYHAARDRIADDNERNNVLTQNGWAVLRFNGEQIQNRLPECLTRIREAANRYGGIRTGSGDVRYFASGEEGTKQMNLFADADEEPA